MFLRGLLTDGNPNPFAASLAGGVCGRGVVPGRPHDLFAVGAFHYDFSDELQSSLQPLLALHDETGFEAWYRCAMTPWLDITADLQVVDPATGDGGVVIAGVRANLRF